jgi:hypothetical protein
VYFQMKLPLTTNLVDRSDDSLRTLSSEVPDLPDRIVTATARAATHPTDQSRREGSSIADSTIW